MSLQKFKIFLTFSIFIYLFIIVVVAESLYSIDILTIGSAIFFILIAIDVYISYIVIKKDKRSGNYFFIALFVIIGVGLISFWVINNYFYQKLVYTVRMEDRGGDFIGDFEIPKDININGEYYLFVRPDINVNVFGHDGNIQLKLIDPENNFQLSNQRYVYVYGTSGYRNHTNTHLDSQSKMNMGLYNIVKNGKYEIEVFSDNPNTLQSFLSMKVEIRQ